MTITASSDKPKSYHYRLLDQIWRDACSSPFEWGLLTTLADTYDPLDNGTYRNLTTGDTITCQGLADGSHSFTFEQGLTIVAGRAGYGEGDRMSWPSSALASWAIQLQDMIETDHFGEHTPTDCRKCRADRIYRDLLELKSLCETHEKKEIK